MNAESKSAQINTRIALLQSVLKANQVDAILIPSSDPHLSEYLPEHWKAREWFSGFTGSMGTLTVSQTKAAVFADSRYWVQAERELDGTIVQLEKIATGNSVNHFDWLVAETHRGGCVAVDGTVMSANGTRLLQSALAPNEVKVMTDADLVGLAWSDRPTLPTAGIYEHELAAAVQSRSEKLQIVRECMARVGAQAHFISTLDDIAWLLNLRGRDVDYNPVFIAHCLVLEDRVELFVDQHKIPADLTQRLLKDGVHLRPYEVASQTLKILGPVTALLIDPKRVTWAFLQSIPKSIRVIEEINPSTLLKSRKLAGQAQHIRKAMEQDGAALCEFFSWFEKTIGKERITELTIDEKITAARASRPGFVCPSFPTIAGFNANGALPHYRALPEAFAVIEGDGLLLIDSGGQYLGGTTDITRVVPVGNISQAMMNDYTMVLRGMINLSMARFPRGTLSPMLDALARAPLWSAGLEYGHGTGHGVGYFMNVHEGPQSISKAIPDPNMAMEAGMITSNEPGLYREGQWGIRIENLVMNVPFVAPFEEPTKKSPFGEFLQFETLTLCPIDTRPIVKSLMRSDEIDWLNQYHAMVRQRLAGLLHGEALAWLEKNTQPL